jgi:hypothetical protein
MAGKISAAGLVIGGVARGVDDAHMVRQCWHERSLWRNKYRPLATPRLGPAADVSRIAHDDAWKRDSNTREQRSTDFRAALAVDGNTIPVLP